MSTHHRPNRGPRRLSALTAVLALFLTSFPGIRAQADVVLTLSPGITGVDWAFGGTGITAGADGISIDEREFLLPRNGKWAAAFGLPGGVGSTDFVNADFHHGLDASVGVSGASGGPVTIYIPTLFLSQFGAFDSWMLVHEPVSYPSYSFGDTITYSGSGNIPGASFSDLNPGQYVDTFFYGQSFILNIVPEPSGAAILGVLLGGTLLLWRKRVA